MALVRWLVSATLLLACGQEQNERTRDAVRVAPLPTAALRTAAEEVAQIEIARHGEAPVVLATSGGSWRIVEPLSYPANPTSVASMLAVLAEIEIVRKVADAPESAHRLSLERQVLIKVRSSDGTASEFSMGASTRDETYVQRSGDEAVYAVRGSCRRFFDLGLNDLRSPAITDIPLESIERVRYRNTPLALALSPIRPGSKRFIEAEPVIPNFDVERASKNVAVLANLNARGFADDISVAAAKFPPKAPTIEIFQRGETTPLVITVGERAENGNLYLRTSASEQFYLVAKHLGSTLMPKQSHFERSEAQMAEQRRQAETAKGPGKARVHTHDAKAPTRVPKAMLKELRALAREQREARAINR